MSNNIIGDSLGLPPIEMQKTEIVERVAPPSDEQEDYKYARENFYNVIEKGTEALEDMLNVAKASEHPRAYEVVSTLMKTLIDANKDLVSMGEKKQKENESQEGSNVTNNNLFVGSTTELQNMLRDLRDGGNSE
jgi:molybdopterin converting factor small subunit